jgi:hypothetical protein
VSGSMARPTTHIVLYLAGIDRSKAPAGVRPMPRVGKAGTPAKGRPVGQRDLHFLMHALQQGRFKDRKVDKDLVPARAYNSSQGGETYRRQFSAANSVRLIGPPGWNLERK